MAISNYLDKLIAEKGLDLEQIIEIEGESGTNWIPLVFVIDAIKAASKGEQDQIRNTLVQIDFKNGDVMHFFTHLAGAIAR